jgi:hypothetical protein
MLLCGAGVKIGWALDGRLINGCDTAGGCPNAELLGGGALATALEVLIGCVYDTF